MNASEATAPIVIDSDPDDLFWDDGADVVVVGFGGAGVCAAIQAREGGLDVLAIDRFEGGGATALSGGVVYAGNTRFQREAGHADTPDEMYNYLTMEVGDVVKPETLRRHCDTSAADMDWLVDNGVPFSGALYDLKTMYPPEGKFLFYSGNERVPQYSSKAKPAPRGHRTVGTGMTGNVLFGALANSARAQGVRLQTYTRASRLIIDGAGRVIGVEVQELADQVRPRQKKLYDRVIPMMPFKATSSERAIAQARQAEARHSVPRRIRARQGVILTTGAFTFNLDMLRKYRPFFAANYKALLRIGSAGCDGSGIALGQSVGGLIDRMDSVYAARNIAPPNALLHGVLVNRSGKRFIDEEAYSGFLGLEIANQADGCAWLILPAKSLRLALRQMLTGGFLFFKFYGIPTLLNLVLGGTRRAGSVRGIARKCGIDADVLEGVISDYGRNLSTGTPDPFGKSRGNSVPFGSGAVYAINMSIPNIYSFTYLFTLGGLRVDEESGAVLGPSEKPIPGLYAAGRSAVGLCSNGYLSGMSLSDCVFSGRRAGQAVSRDITRPSLAAAVGEEAE